MEVGGDLESLLQAIKSSEVLEDRIGLIYRLESSFVYSADDLSSILDSLIVSWDDSGCSGLSHCMLHKSILQVALKCSCTDTAGCLGQFLALGAKASSWCGKHLLSSVEFIDDSQQEEHSRILPEIISMALNISIKILPSTAKCVTVDMVHNIGDFISELLSLMESSIVDNDKTLLNLILVDEITKLCRAYSEAAKVDNCTMSITDEDATVKHNEQGLASDVTRITSSAIQTMCRLGIYAASSGGSQVTLLNASWKGVVSLLQSGKGMIEGKVNVREIIVTLLSLSVESLRVAAETWCTPLLETLGATEARRTFLPIKFFLINAVRICSIYPSEAMIIYKNIINCALVITSSSILFSKKPRLKAANEALAELLEPTLFVLLDTLMKSSDLTPESKCQLAHYFFENEEAKSPDHMGQANQREINLSSLDCIFSTDSDVDHRNRALLHAELLVFLHFLNASSWLAEMVVIALSKKLQTLLNILTSEDIYSYVLGFQIPAFNGADHSPAVVWQPVFTSIIQALKTFMISTVASIFLLLKTVASPEDVLAPLSALRKVARSLCMILSYASSATVDQIYTSVLNGENSSKSSILHLALLMEGFPLGSLSDGTKELAVKKMFTSFAGYLESYSKNHRVINVPTSSLGVIGLPVHALASTLQHCVRKDDSIVDEKSITAMFKFTISLIKMYRTAPDSSTDNLAKHISSMLVIISNTRHLCAFSEMEQLTLQLRTLFLSTSDKSNAVLSQCKPSMTSFMSTLGHLNITEDDANELCSAICDLYHLLLKERHWALMHLSMDSFGYFAARTSFTQLWRSVPGDAALSYNASTGTSIDENGFMLGLRAYLQKEVSLHTDKWSEEQIRLLVSEGRALKKLVEAYCEIPVVSEPEKAPIAKDASTKKRKMPDGICEGMAMLQNGLKVMHLDQTAFDEADFAELKHRFAAHLSRLEDAVSQFASLSDEI
ncbi:unnamed protein product [Miscanthus lutarioriparius]|uniref:Uncharacterized protein n=1 Tax=Miscanthus lutarioriparius TaxID=422564 RepID=A0A811MM42_9POAL|nr:unnamed protein product [Miscanthus lutarioriparius]